MPTTKQPASPSEPRHLELDDKSKGSLFSAETSSLAQGKDTLHEDRLDGDIPGSSMMDANQKMDVPEWRNFAKDALWQECW
jgi:hypothetical protein